MSSIWTVRRTATDRKVSGLAAGLARVWNVDPVLIRVGFAILALSGGIGVVLYLAGWLMVPEEGKQASYLDQAIPQTRGWSRELRLVIVAAACVIGLVALSSVAPFSFAAAVVMAAVWYFGYYRNRPQQADPPAAEPVEPPMQFAEFTGEPTPFTEAARAWQDRIVEYQQTVRQQQAEAQRAEQLPAEDPYREEFLAHPDPVGLYAEPAPTADVIETRRARTAQRRRSARRLGLVSLAVLALTLGGLGVASSLGVVISPAIYLSAALLVMGLTLLAGTRFGRPPGMAVVAILTAVAMAFTLTAERVPVIGDDSVGVQKVSFSTGAAMPAEKHVDAGQLTIDLRDLQLTSTRTFTASVGTGRLIVLLPRDVGSTVDYRVDDGTISITGQPRRWGSQLTGTAQLNGQHKTSINLDLLVGQGQLEVRR
ncbi:PspC domain-containing protein [Microlunatus elymi]|uniref:PspC domain-containing protein n=1 Tax=Microlunatus elymi TaxID=2596828 RepID=A0A516PWQ6_9ACTN|nr:PspC domain-containing protein [Microlunatus elymi]QDP95614.1 PspC domain-containing protein [Microlunatus elymi]